MEVLKQRVESLKAKRIELEKRAADAKRGSATATQEAARDAAELNAHTKAVAIVHDTAVRASKYARRAEAEWEKAESIRSELDTSTIKVKETIIAEQVDDTGPVAAVSFTDFVTKKV
jgi:predicted  nucleic acid-binding Zn-ribbon protein